MTEVMPFGEFKYIMEQIQAHSEKLGRLSDFFEKELCTDSWCIVNVGEKLSNILCCMLADHFNCWWEINDTGAQEKVNGILESMGLPPSKGFSREWWDETKRRYDNDIEYWLYEENKKIVIDGEEIPIETLEEFYNYLISHCVDKK